MSAHLQAAYKARIDKLEAECIAKKAELNVAIDELKGVHKDTIVTPLNMSGDTIQAVLDALGEEKIAAETPLTATLGAINDEKDERIAEAVSKSPTQGGPALTSEIQRIQLETYMRFMLTLQMPSAEGEAGS